MYTTNSKIQTKKCVTTLRTNIHRSRRRYKESASYHHDRELETISFKVGGGSDVSVFREKIKQGIVPDKSDITFEGIFSEYYFDVTSNVDDSFVECVKNGYLFCPSYSQAVSPSLDAFLNQSNETVNINNNVNNTNQTEDTTNSNHAKDLEYYVTVTLNSGVDQRDFERKKLNLVIVLDISGSMDLPFDEENYKATAIKQHEQNQNHNNESFKWPNELMSEWKEKSKLQIAKESIIELLGKSIFCCMSNYTFLWFAFYFCIVFVLCCLSQIF